MPREDVSSRVATQLTDWLSTTPRKIADLWAGGGDPPFAARLSVAESDAYFRSKVFLPDGVTPNAPGRQMLLETRTMEEFADIMRSMLKGQPGTVDTLDTPAQTADQQQGTHMSEDY